MRFLSEKDVKFYNSAYNRCYFKQKLNKGKLIKVVSFFNFEDYRDVIYTSEINGIINIYNTSRMNEQKTIFFVITNANRLSIKEINKKDYDHGFIYNNPDFSRSSCFIPSFKNKSFIQLRYDFRSILSNLNSFKAFLKHIESTNQNLIFT
jgi:hypothetical protein